MKRRVLVTVSHPMVAASIAEALRLVPECEVVRCAPAEAAERAREGDAIIVADVACAREIPPDVRARLLITGAGDGLTARALADELGAAGWLLLDEVAEGVSQLLRSMLARPELQRVVRAKGRRGIVELVRGAPVPLALLAVVAVAALIGVGALLASGGPPSFPGLPAGELPAAPRSEPPATASMPPPVDAASADATPAGSPAPEPSRPPELSALVRPLAASWRPQGTALIVEQIEPAGGGVTLLAIPISPGTPTPLAKLDAHLGWDVRGNGSLLVVSLRASASATATRLAILDLRNAESRWLTTAEDGTIDRSPLWSLDGASVYVGRSAGSADLGLFRVPVGGGPATRLRGPAEPAFASTPQVVTSDGALVFTHDRGDLRRLRVLDLPSGRELAFGEASARLEAWRPTRPRALVATLPGSATPGTADSLMRWDDLGGTTTALVEAPVAGADWEPGGTRIVVATRAGSDPFALVTMGASGAGRTAIPGSENAMRPLWLRAGIVYVWDIQPGDASVTREVRLIASSGGTPRTLYRADGLIGRLQFVSP